MSGLLALLDDVAAIAKVAAASVDDVMGQAVKASSKAAGAVIDDAAVTPKYLHGFEASRELPIVWRIARGSLDSSRARASVVTRSARPARRRSSRRNARRPPTSGGRARGPRSS